MDLSLPTVNDVGARPDLLSRNIAAEFRVDRDRILENRRELVGHLNALKKIHRNALILAKDAERGTVFPRIVVRAPIYETEAMVHAPKVSPKCTFFLPQKYRAVSYISACHCRDLTISLPI